MREFAIDFPLGLEFLWKAFVTFTARVPAWDGGEGGGGRGRGGRVGKNQSKIFRLLLSSHKTVRATASTPKKALSTVSVSHLYYSVIQRAREAISG